MYIQSKAVSRWFIIPAIFLWFVSTSQAHWYDANLAAAVADAASVSDAVDIVTEALEKDSFDVVLVVDHAAAAASVDLVLPPTQVIFARPPKRLERALLRRSETIGIDLPVKILIFEDGSGVRQVRINPIGYLLDRHLIKTRDFDLWLMNKTVNSLADPDNGLITVPSNHSVMETVSALETILTDTGVFRIPLKLDYFEGSRKKEETLIVFGNPNAGTPLMQATREIALDLPQKFLVWEDRKGHVFITYNDPFFIARRHNLQGQEERLTAISNALANFAGTAAAE